jgi:hypothetical protein
MAFNFTTPEQFASANKAMGNDPEARKTLLAAGLLPNLVTGAPFAILIRDDLRRYTEIKVNAKMVVE